MGTIRYNDYEAIIKEIVKYSKNKIVSGERINRETILSHFKKNDAQFDRRTFDDAITEMDARGDLLFCDITWIAIDPAALSYY